MTVEYSVKYKVQKYTGRENEGDIQFEVKEYIFNTLEDIEKFVVSNLPKEPLSLQLRTVTDLDFIKILNENLYTLFYFNNGISQKKSFKTFEDMNSFVNSNKEYKIERVKFPKSVDWFKDSIEKS